MTNYLKLFYFVALVVVFGSCKKEETFKTYDRPAWYVNHPAYSVSMTAVVKLPDNLNQYRQDDDLVAAFSNEECRGIGVLIDGVYYVTIKGNPEDQTNIAFRYYGMRNKYLYNTGAFLVFEQDGTYGSASEPSTLSLNIVQD